ncbi:hypothetical protein JW926_11675 [Candidatus Sumerlaeota bacterium]|nr:hypothetical protein [Candidatus Sumerlaeota bacterium]
MMRQLSFIEIPKTVENKEWGTFKDSLRAPIHNWFTYPAGFSFKAVESSIRNNCIRQGQVVYDPFMGSGTTNLVAKKLAINSYGIEAHPFVFRIARTKMNWEIDEDDIFHSLREVEKRVINRKRHFAIKNIQACLEKEFPDLILKCFENIALMDLLSIRNAVLDGNFTEDVKDIFFVGLTSILRQVSTAATGWPYIAPNKHKSTSLNKNVLHEFIRMIHKMVSDIRNTVHEANVNYPKSSHEIFNADCRKTKDLIPDLSVDHVFTSPPYLNNFDYADRTRLELYFWGEAKNWGDISENIRTRLITSATTQISRDDPKYQLLDELNKSCPKVCAFLKASISQLSEIRLTRGGKKSYDLLVGGYFNDIYQMILEVYRVLKNNSKAVFVLGDSAPYGIHIPTDDLIGEIGLGVGFSEYHVDVLRERGGKWKDNPQRHGILLRESIVTLEKA